MSNEPDFASRWKNLPVPDFFRGKLFNSNNDILEKIEGLSKINIFVGENNAGKSLLLRELLKQQYSRNEINDEQKNAEFIQQVKSELLDFWETYKDIYNITEKLIISSPAYIKGDENKIKGIIENLTNIEKYKSDIDVYYYFLSKWIDDVKGSDNNVITNILNKANIRKDNDILERMIEILESFISKLKQSFYIFETPLNLEKIFIPTHRTTSTRLIDSGKLNEYFNSNYHFSQDNSSMSRTTQKSKDQSSIINDTINMDNYINIHSGLNFFDELKEMLLTDSKTREKLSEFEEFIWGTFFNGQEFSITPGEYISSVGQDGDTNIDGEKEIIIKKGKDENLKVYDLGTGLQMIMILTWPIFFYDRGMIFIEEPELFLHPKFQNQLLDFLASKKTDEFQFFIATHSNHIIDSLNYQDKTSILTIQKKESTQADDPKFILDKVKFGEISPYELLGVKASSLAFANCIIWVEGPSDRIYINKWIKILSNDLLKEGMHYQIIIYGGNLKAHFTWKEDDDIGNDFIKTIKINHHSIFVTDSDKSNVSTSLKGTVKRIKEEFENLDGICWITEGREIEDYLTKEIITETFKNVDVEIEKYEKFDNYFEKLKKCGVGSKYSNKVVFAKKVVQAMNKENIDRLDLEEKVSEIIEKIKEWNDIKV